MKHLFFRLLKVACLIPILGISSIGLSQNFVTVGNGNNITTSLSATPYSTLFEDGRHMYLYPSGQLANNGMVAGMILSLGFDVGSTSGFALNGFTIKISTLPQGVNVIPTNWPTNSTVVYSSAVPIVPVLGWNQYTFQTPFYYNGTDGLIVEVCFDNNSWGGSTGVRYSYLNNKVRGRYADNNIGCSMTGGFSSSYRPNIRFENVPAATNDAGVSALINPTFPTCAMDSNVQVSINTLGSVALTSATVNWSVNGNLQTPFMYTGNLAQFNLDTITLGTVAGGLMDGDTLKVWTSMPNGVADSSNFNDTIEHVLYNAMAGTYTILPNGGGDFTSFTEAIQRMSNYGVCGDVVVQAADSTYLEQISIGNIPGNSDSATITFAKIPGGGRPKIEYGASGSADNYVVHVENASYITLDSLTLRSTGTGYCRVLTAGANAHHITVDGCYLEAGSSSNTSTNRANVYLDDATDASHWHFTNNVFYRGSYGIKYWGGSSTDLHEGTIIANNRFTDQRFKTLDIYYQSNLQLTGNLVQSWLNYANGIGIIVGYSNGGVIANNHVKGTNSWPKYGIQCLGLSGTLANMVQVVNNRVHVPSGTSNVGIRVSDNLFVHYAFNSVYKSAFNYNQNRGFYIQGNGHVELRNNNVQIRKSGTAIYVEGTSLAVCDYNNLSAPDSTCRVGWINGSYHDSLSHWQQASGFDSNSISVDSVYTDTLNLLVCNPELFQKGTPLSWVSTDYRGAPRLSTPSIGAHEFMPIGDIVQNLEQTICDGDTITLEQNYFDTILWNGVQSANSISVHSPGVQILAVNGLCGVDTLQVNITGQDHAQLTNVNLCEGETEVISSGISSGDYLWNNGEMDSVLVVDSAQVIWVEVVDTNGCFSSDSAIITQSVDVDLPDSLAFCQGSSVSVDANMQGIFSWNTGQTSQVVSVNQPGFVSVTVTDQNCISTDSTYISEILDVIPSFEDSSSVYTVKFTNTTQNATTYHWDFGDGTFSTEEHPIHFYPWTTEDSVAYTVVLTASNGDCHTATFTNEQVMVGQLVSVSNVSLANEVKVYPNPSNGLFSVEMNLSNPSAVDILVYDTRGTEIMRKNVPEVMGLQTVPMNLDNKPVGIYFVKVVIGKEQLTYKILVQ